MTPEKFLLFAKKAGMDYHEATAFTRGEGIYCGESDYPINDELMKFADLVIAEEREACADMADAHGAPDLALNIRARE